MALSAFPHTVRESKVIRLKNVSVNHCIIRPAFVTCLLFVPGGIEAAILLRSFPIKSNNAFGSHRVRPTDLRAH